MRALSKLDRYRLIIVDDIGYVRKTDAETQVLIEFIAHCSAELAGINAFDYLCMLQRHAVHMAEHPEQWMPWNYQETVQGIVSDALPTNSAD